jgi:hypothetical protein
MPKPEVEFTLGVKVKGSLAEALIAESKKTLAPYAAITRAALVEYLNKRGYNAEDELVWGGPREHAAEEDQQGQLVPAPVG